MKRLKFFVPEKKRIVCEEGKVISEATIKKQLADSEFYKWMARNRFEYEIYQKFQTIVDGEEEYDKIALMKKTNKELGFNMFEIVQEDGEDEIRRMKDILMGNPEEDKPFSFEITYEEFGKRYRFEKTWIRRKRDVEKQVVRLYIGYPGTAYFYLRKLLRCDRMTHIFYPEDLMRHPETGEEYKDYREICVALNLVNSSKEYFHCIHESQQMGFGRWKLLGLFAQMIIATDINNILEIWNGPKVTPNIDLIERAHLNGFKEDMMLFPEHVKKMPGFNWKYSDLPNDIIRNECEQYTLRKLKYILERSGVDYPKELPPVIEQMKENRTKEWLAAHNFDSEKAKKIYASHKSSMEGNNRIGKPNPEQLNILAKIEGEIKKYNDDPAQYGGFVAMLDAPGGTGKTFLIETLAAYCALPTNNFLCLCSAFSGVAAQLLPNGVTIHRRFNMVPDMDPEVNCNIDRESTKAELLKEAKLIVMDEVTMMSKIDLERIDRTLRLIMNKEDVPFGGKIILLSGDFRQILPVEKNPFDSCNTCLKTSYLWDKIVQLPLTINERVRQFGGHAMYATFLMYLGLGLLQQRSDKLHYRFKEYSDEFIRLPRKVGDTEIIRPYSSLEDFVQQLYPTLETSLDIPETIILTPKNVNMYEINRLCIERFKPDEEPRSLFSFDEAYITVFGLTVSNF